jgi:toxin ParE1/3/4
MLPGELLCANRDSPHCYDVVPETLKCTEHAASTHGDDFLLEVHVLHPQPQQFHQPKASAVHDLRHQAAVRMEELEKPLEFLAAQPHWQVRTDLGTTVLRKVAKLSLEDLPKEAPSDRNTLIWSPTASEDLRHLVRYIATDSPERAAAFGLRLIERVEQLQRFLEMGRMVPERRDRCIREIIVRPYRVIYRVTHECQLLEIVRVWHAARGEPEGVNQTLQWTAGERYVFNPARLARRHSAFAFAQMVGFRS